MSKKKNKRVVVDRRFLMNLANVIYDTKSRRFLRLCDGSLVNGPDPTDKKRSMHCGLGELYYAMTDRHPRGVGEEDVVDLAVELSPLRVDFEDISKHVRNTLEKLKLPKAVVDGVCDDISLIPSDDYRSKEEKAFRDILNSIPTVNDDGCGDDEQCDYNTFRRRSQRVAAKLRAAAKILPEMKEEET